MSSVTADRASRPTWFPDKLGAGTGKNKDNGHFSHATNSLGTVITLRRDWAL
jgi:hypothetical protein